MAEFPRLIAGCRFLLPVSTMLASTACQPAVGAPGSSSAIYPPADIAQPETGSPTAPRFPPGPYVVLEAAAGVPLEGSVTGTQSVKLGGAFVYFTDPDDRYYAVRVGEGGNETTLLSARTDESGAFRTPPVFPVGTHVVAGALLASNRRLVGFATAGDAASVSVDPASTYVIEFLRAAAGGSLAASLGDAAVRRTLGTEIVRAGSLVAAGKLSEPDDRPGGDLQLGRGFTLASRYIVDVLATQGDAYRAWASVLPRPVRALTTFAGNFLLRFDDGKTPVPATSTGLYVPTSVAWGGPADPAVYIAEGGYHRIKRVQDGMIATSAGAYSGEPADPAALNLSGDGTPASEALLPGVREVAPDGAGNLAVTFIAGERLPFHTVGFLCRRAGMYFGRAMSSDTFYRLGAPDGLPGWIDGPLAAARFREPFGLAFDDAGNLFVADRLNNRVRRISGASGDVTTVLGDGWPYLESVATSGPLLQPVFALRDLGVPADGDATTSVTATGRFVDVPEAGTGSGLRASFNQPSRLVWRRIGSVEELFVLDPGNSAIRRAIAGAGGTFRDAAVTTLIGEIVGFAHPAGYEVPVGRTGAVSEGDAAAALLDLAEHDPATGEIRAVAAGMALDPEWGRLYVADSGNRAVRMVDLGSGRVSTVATHDPRAMEGDALRISLSSLLGGLAVLGDHGLLVVDQGNHTVRRFHTQFDR